MHAFGAPFFRPRIVLFVALLGWYLYAVVDVRLVFEARDDLFLWNSRFFTDFIGQPGGLMKWADGLLVQWCYYGWPGAIALAGLAWLLLAATMSFMDAIARAEVGGAWVIPGMFLVLLHSEYFVAKAMILGLTLAIIAANVWVGLPVGRLWLRLALFAVLSMILYYLAGAAYYCFLACCVVHEALAEKRWRWGVWLLLAGAVVRFGLVAALSRLDLASRNYHVRSLDPFRQAPPGWWMVLFLCYFPGCATLVALRHEVGRGVARLRERLGRPAGGKAAPKRDQGKKHRKPAGPKPNAAPTITFRPLRWTAITILVLALPAAVGWFAFDGKGKGFLEIDYCAEHQLWDDLLAKARKLRYYSCPTNHDVNLALYHTGRLPYEMFSYPQTYPQIIFHEEQFPGLAKTMLRKPCALLLELGRVNEAERAALDMLELCPTGRTLKRLAMIKLIKRQPAAARVFLNVLRDDLILGHWAEACLQRLGADPELAGDEEVQRTRRLMISEDDLNQISRVTVNGDVAFDFHAMLLALLKHNNRNRMAFEYLVAMHLLECDVGAAVELFPFLAHLAYPALPPYYEEAALIYGSQHPREVEVTTAGVFFRGRKLSESTWEKYRRFESIVRGAGGSIQRAAPALARELPGSYFHYYMTHSGG